MIINIFFSAIIAIITNTFGILPSLPDMPAGITNALDNIPEVVRFASRLITMYVGRTFMLVLIPLVVLFLNFNWIYHLTMWAIKKLPIGVK